MKSQVVILAGGGGERLWPLSTKRCPKPFLKIPGKRMLIEQAISRAKKVTSSDHIWIVATQQLASSVKTYLPRFSKKQLIIEPSSKNTAPALMLAAKTLEKRWKQPVPMLVLPADHCIPDEKAFVNKAKLALQRADKQDVLLTFGIQVRSPKTSYGYIRRSKSRVGSFYGVQRFEEKPNKQQAQKYMRSGEYYWNSGMFCWKTNVFMAQMSRYAKKVYQAFQNEHDLTRIYKHVPNLSIDYALMEKSKSIEVLPCSFKWTDLGSWDSVYDILPKAKGKNASLGPLKVLEGQGNLVVGQKDIVLFGVNDLVVVESDSNLLITTKSQAPHLKRLVKTL